MVAAPIPFKFVYEPLNKSNVLAAYGAGLALYAHWPKHINYNPLRDERQGNKAGTVAWRGASYGLAAKTGKL